MATTRMAWVSDRANDGFQRERQRHDATLDEMRIITNLVDNAGIHGGAGVTVSAWLETSVLHVVVADTGPGVPEDELERIFDRFVKADSSRGSGGSGLGLAIVREHARVLGASITARNRDEGGLAVELVLPVQTVSDL